MLLYPLFYKQFGIRKPQQLIEPNVFPLESFNFPRSAIYHFIPTTETELGPDPNLPYFSIFKKRMPIFNTTELVSVASGGKRNNLNPNALFKPYLIANKQFRLDQIAIEDFTDQLTPIIHNLGLLPALYRYNDIPLMEYNRWHDIQKTLWRKIALIADKSTRQQFIFINVPPILPSLPSLRMYESKISNSFLKVFDTPDKWLLMEFWKWLSPDDGVTSVIDAVAEKSLSNINCILFFNSKWCLLNLGTLFEWIEKKTKEENENLIKMPIVQIQKLFVRLCIAIQTKAATTVIETPLAPTISENNQTTISNSQTSTTDNTIIDETTEAPTYDEYKELNLTGDEEFVDIFTEVDKDLSNLDKIENTLTYVRNKPSNDSVKRKVVSGVEVTQPTESKQDIEQAILNDKTIQDSLEEYLSYYAEAGIMSAVDYRNLEKQINSVDKVISPYNTNKTLLADIKIQPRELSLSKTPLPNLANVPDQSMHSTTLLDFNAKYINNIMPKDTMGMVANIQRAGIILQDYSVEKDSSIMGDYEIHTLKLKPIDGASSTIRFKLPIVNEEGEFVINGEKYYQRKQRGDMPIRKINANVVALTSYYGKVFVNRSEKRADDSDFWLSKKIILEGLAGNNPLIKDVVLGDSFNNKLKVPKIYSGMSKYLRSVTINNRTYIFNYQDRQSAFTPEVIAKYEKNGSVLVGKSRSGFPIIVTNENEFFIIRNKELVSLGYFTDITGYDQTKMPVDYTTLKVFRKEIPLAFVLGYYLGIDRLLTLLDVKPRIVVHPQKVLLKNNEWSIKFKDKSLIFNRKDRQASLLLAGFNAYKNSIKLYPYDIFNNTDIYLNVLENQKIGIRYLRELETLMQLFIDPITKGILEEMKEPVTFIGLLLRANELLMSDDYPDVQDLAHMRIKGYERFPGLVYTQLVASVRDYKARNIRGKSKIEMSPYAVWREISIDPSKSLVSNINPIENLKQKEAITYVGTGGRSKESMSRETRIYHSNDMGTISEATVDSGDVGINTFSSANPLFNSLRGTSDRFDYSDNGVANLISTSALLSIAADMDDSKRVNFISVQNSHTIATVGYHQPLVRTGYEEVIPYRCGEMFAYIAKRDGKVISRTNDGIVIEYNDGEKKGIILGIRFGNAEGSTYPHTIASNLTTNDVFIAGDPIAYHAGFFEQDLINPKKIIWKSAKLVKTALYESSQTHEDGNAISKATAEAMTTTTTKVKTFVVDFKQGIKNILPIGKKLEPTDILFIIEDEITNAGNLFDEESLKTLQLLSNKAPKAKTRGTIANMEVFYHGNKDDMSVSLKALTDQCDKRMGQREQAVGKKKTSGQVTNDYRVEGKPLNLDNAEIKVYINVEDIAGVGDKLVFANQMKSVIGEVLENKITTESGEVVDAVFGARSITNRIVLSPFILGTTNTLLKIIGKKAVELFRS